MITYIYGGKRFCKECGLAIRRNIASLCRASLDPENPWSYDSNEFPKGPYCAQQEEGTPNLLCGSGQNCLSRPGGIVVGSEYGSVESGTTKDPWTDVDASLLSENAMGPQRRVK